tara:strand:- start:919 stop:1071 length:153 start_codon:yes stop_codon:yes gene_type:complete
MEALFLRIFFEFLSTTSFIRRYSVFLGLPFLEKYISPSIDKSLADAVGEF